MYLEKEQLKKLIDGRPQGTSEQQIYEGLVRRGDTFQGIEAMPLSVRQNLESQQTQTPEVKGLPNLIGGGQIAQGFAQTLSGRASGLSDQAGGLTQNANQLIAEAKKFPTNSPRRKQLLQQAQQMSSSLSNEANSFLGELPTNKQVIGSAAKLATTIGALGVSAPATVGGRIGLGAGIGGAFGATNAAEENKKTGSIVGEGLIGAGIGMGTAGAIEGIKWAVRGIPKLLAYTSNVPEEVMQRQYDNPQLSSTILKGVKKEGTVGVLDDIQNASKTLRTSLTQQYQEGAKVLVQGNTGTRVMFNSKEISLLEKVADDFGIDLPQNMNKISVKEGLALNKEINELFSKRAVRESAQGVIVRKTKDLVTKKLSQFEGFKDFMNNYAGEKGVLDAINDIVKPYATSPITKSTALSRVKAIFNDNRPAFLSAVKDLEEATGIPFLSDKAAALNILQRAPIAGQRLLSQLIELVAFPVTSPRSAGFLSRTAGRVAQSPALQPLRNIVSEGIRRTLR